MKAQAIHWEICSTDRRDLRSRRNSGVVRDILVEVLSSADDVVPHKLESAVEIVRHAFQREFIEQALTCFARVYIRRHHYRVVIPLCSVRSHEGGPELRLVDKVRRFVNE